MFKNDPRKFWRLAMVLAPLWLVVAAAVFVTAVRFPVNYEPVNIPQTKSQDAVLHPILGGSVQSYSCIWKRPLRQQLTNTEKPKASKPQPHERPLNLKLIGTAVEGTQSYAFVRVPSGDIEVLKVGSAIESFVIIKIEPDRVCISRDNMVRYLTLPQATRKVIPTNKVTTSKTTEHQAISTMLVSESTFDKPIAEQLEPIKLMNYSGESFLRDVRLVPCIGASGRQMGFRIDSMSSNSLLATCGLAPGDVIISVDQKELTQLADLERICLSLEDGNKHTWQIQRQSLSIKVEIGQAKEIVYESEKN